MKSYSIDKKGVVEIWGIILKPCASSFIPSPETSFKCGEMNGLKITLSESQGQFRFLAVFHGNIIASSSNNKLDVAVMEISDDIKSYFHDLGSWLSHFTRIPL